MFAFLNAPLSYWGHQRSTSVIKPPNSANNHDPDIVPAAGSGSSEISPLSHGQSDLISSTSTNAPNMNPIANQKDFSLLDLDMMAVDPSLFKPRLPLTYNDTIPSRTVNTNKTNDDDNNNENNNSVRSSPLFSVHMVDSDTDSSGQTRHGSNNSCYYADRSRQEEVTPILHPNEVLLQQFPNKMSMKRVSELRIASRSRDQQRVPGLILPHTNNNNNNNNTNTNTRTNKSNNHGHTSSSGSCSTSTSSAGSINAHYQEKEPETESDHGYLTRSGVKGTVYVTSERLLFVPNPKKHHGPLTGTLASATPCRDLEHEFEISYSTIDTMRVVQSNQGFRGKPPRWYFVCYDFGIYVTTLPFRTLQHAESFLKLVANIRFEQMIRQSLPPRYTSPAAAFSHCSNHCITERLKMEEEERVNGGDSRSGEGCVFSMLPLVKVEEEGQQQVQVQVQVQVQLQLRLRQLQGQRLLLSACNRCAAALDLADWDAEDGKLPSYAESEEAVRQYLIKLNLMSKDAKFDRQNATLEIFAMLAQACSPPASWI